MNKYKTFGSPTYREFEAKARKLLSDPPLSGVISDVVESTLETVFAG
ncbi:hypothetical protein [Trichloromonas sp.]